MSRSIDLFIDAPFELSELAAQLGELIGTPLALGPGGDLFVLAEGDTVAYLGPHPFVDDGELLLTRYNFALSSRVPSGQSVPDSQELALLRHVAEMVRRRTTLPALLVHDLQNRDKGGGARPALPVASDGSASPVAGDGSGSPVAGDRPSAVEG